MVRFWGVGVRLRFIDGLQGGWICGFVERLVVCLAFPGISVPQGFAGDIKAFFVAAFVADMNIGTPWTLHVGRESINISREFSEWLEGLCFGSLIHSA